MARLSEDERRLAEELLRDLESWAFKLVDEPIGKAAIDLLLAGKTSFSPLLAQVSDSTATAIEQLCRVGAVEVILGFHRGNQSSYFRVAGDYCNSPDDPTPKHDQDLPLRIEFCQYKLTATGESWSEKLKRAGTQMSATELREFKAKYLVLMTRLPETEGQWWASAPPAEAASVAPRQQQRRSRLSPLDTTIDANPDLTDGEIARKHNRRFGTQFNATNVKSRRQYRDKRS